MKTNHTPASLIAAAPELLEALESLVRQLEGFGHQCPLARAAIAKAYDPHAENKALYAKDEATYKEPWKLWEFSLSGCNKKMPLVGDPLWIKSVKYRRIQTKQLVDWSCPLLKGCNTNYGELFTRSDKHCSWLTGNGICPVDKNLRIAPPANDKSNWQAYNGKDFGKSLLALHKAGFILEIKYVASPQCHLNQSTWSPSAYYTEIVAYRVIGICDDFTDNPEEAQL